MKRDKLIKICVTALFTALAFLMTFIFRFKVGFLTFDFKDAVISIISLLYGPVYGVSSVVAVAVLELISVSDTGIYGLIMNIISSSVFALTIGGIYRLKRNFSGAIIAAVTSVITVTIAMMVANIFITPLYMEGTTRQEVISMIIPLLLPFNLCKSIVNASTLMIIYKPITSALRKTRLIKIEGTSKYRFTTRSAVLFFVSLIFLIAAVVFILKVLGGSFTFL